MSDFKLPKKDQPVYPTKYYYTGGSGMVMSDYQVGITKKELFALEILKAIVPPLTENRGNAKMDAELINRAEELAVKLLDKLESK
jgi:hypothetical protein